MQFESWLRRRDVQRWLAILVLGIIAALTGRGGGGPNTPGPDLAGDTVEGFPKLVDGDSFHMSGYEVRMKGIDAPEGKQTCIKDGRDWSCGEAARSELQRMVGGQKVVCKVEERDQHNRLLAFCSAGGRDLNGGMVASGMALSYGSYIKEETAAKLARRGLWGSQFQRPREWRREHGIGGPGRV